MSRRGYVAAVCDCGAARTGPVGAWWVEATSRGAGRSGISGELPAGRTIGWNFALAVVEAAAGVTAHLAGVPWSQIGMLFGGLAVLVVVSIGLTVFVLGPRTERRHARQLEVWRAMSEARLREQFPVPAAPAIERARVVRGELVDAEAVV